MSDNQMTIYGNVGTPVDLKESGDFAWAMFRVGSTPRFFDRNRGAWRDLETVWVTVKATRALAHNVTKSLTTGDPVVVVGRLRSYTWDDKDTGETRRRDVLEATTVAHDLNRGTSRFTRNEPAATPERTASAEGEAVAAFEERHETPSSSPSSAAGAAGAVGTTGGTGGGSSAAA